MAILGLGLDYTRNNNKQSIGAFIASLGYAGSTAGALFDLGRYWLPSTTDPTKPVEVTQDDWFAQFACADTSGVRQYQDKDGLVKYATGMTNKPVFDYQLGRRSLLADLAYTNVLLYNQDFNNAVWTAYTVKPSDLAKNATSPTGAANDAWSFTKAGAGGGTAGLAYEIGTLTNNQFGVGVWLKADAPTVMKLGVDDAHTTTINVTTSWVFYSFAGTDNVNFSTTRYFQLYFNTSDNTGLSSSSKVYIYAPIAVMGFTGRPVTSVLTTSTAVTLPATTNRIPARAEALFSNPYTMLIDCAGNRKQTANSRLVSMNNVGRIRSQSPSNAAWWLQITNSYTIGTNSQTPCKIAYGGSATTNRASYNGGAVAFNSDSAIPAINQLDLRLASSNYYRLVLFPSLLSDAQLQALST